jgi:hypothetical protein
METTNYEATSGYTTTDTNDKARTSSPTKSDDKAHYAADDDINWDAWWGEYIDSME